MQRPSALWPESLASSLKAGCNQIIHSPAPHFQESVLVGEVIRWLPLVAPLAHSCLEAAKFPSAALAAALTRCVPWPWGQHLLPRPAASSETQSTSPQGPQLDHCPIPSKALGS